MSDFLANRVASLAAVLALAVCLAGPASAQVGVVSVTDGGSSVQQGSDLQIGQRITTGSDGRVHLMFVDGSAVTVGPDSTVALENFAYDAAGKKGTLALHVERGTVRFVGGAISKTADAQIRTPSSTIGIRGGIAAVTVSDGGSTSANFLHGSAMRVSGQGITQTATRSGSQINVPAGGQPRPPTVLAAGQLSAIQSLDRVPSTATMASRPIRMTGSAVDTAFAKSGLDRQNPGTTAPRSPTAPSPIMQVATQAVQTSQHQLGQQQFVGLLAAKPTAFPMPTDTPMPALPSPTPAAAPVVPAAKPAPAAGGTTVSAGILPRGSGGAVITGMGGRATLVMIGIGTVTLAGTNHFAGSTTIIGTK